MSKLCLKRLSKEMKMYAEDDFKFPNLILRPQENNLLRWYFIVYDLQDTPYENGFYFGKVNLPSEYPLKPPDFYFITPNGRFEVNTKICTTFSGFHEETYTSTWNILTMMEGMISFMTDEHQNGIGSIEITTEQRQELALQSYLFNKNNIEFNSVFPDFDDLIEVVKQV